MNRRDSEQHSTIVGAVFLLAVVILVVLGIALLVVL